MAPLFWASIFAVVLHKPVVVVSNIIRMIDKRIASYRRYDTIFLVPLALLCPLICLLLWAFLNVWTSVLLRLVFVFFPYQSLRSTFRLICFGMWVLGVFTMPFLSSFNVLITLATLLVLTMLLYGNRYVLMVVFTTTHIVLFTPRTLLLFSPSRLSQLLFSALWLIDSLFLQLSQFSLADYLTICSLTFLV